MCYVVIRVPYRIVYVLCSYTSTIGLYILIGKCQLFFKLIFYYYTISSQTSQYFRHRGCVTLFPLTSELESKQQY
jgi:hypothetical protein